MSSAFAGASIVYDEIEEPLLEKQSVNNNNNNNNNKTIIRCHSQSHVFALGMAFGCLAQLVGINGAVFIMYWGMGIVHAYFASSSTHEVLLFSFLWCSAAIIVIDGTLFCIYRHIRVVVDDNSVHMNHNDDSDFSWYWFGAIMGLVSACSVMECLYFETTSATACAATITGIIALCGFLALLLPPPLADQEIKMGSTPESKVAVICV